MKKVMISALALGLCFFFCINVNCQNSVKIGDQTWMTTNLNVSKFRNGDPIPEAKTYAEWSKAASDEQPAWCYYNNDPSNGAKYGKLYNWWAVNDPRGLAPEGWHIPYEEHSELFEYKGFENENELKSTYGWDNYETVISCSRCEGEGWYFQSTCTKCKGTQEITIVNSGNGDNKTGFSSFPAGYRTSSGDFYGKGEYAFFWSNNHDKLSKPPYCWYITNDGYLKGSYCEKGAVFLGKESGLSVRCVKDSKEYLEKLANQKKLQDVENKIKNFDKEFSEFVSKGNALDNFKYLKENKSVVFAMLDNNKKQLGRIAITAREVLESVIQELVSSIDQNEEGNFEYTNSFFKIVESQDFIDYEKKILSILTDSYFFYDLKKKVGIIEKFISFKSKIRRQRTRELTDLEKQIFGQWKFQSNKGITTILDLKNNRDIEISEITTGSGKRKTGVKISKIGVWGYDGENLSFYPEWDFKIGVFSNSKIYEKNQKKISKKLEPKFLRGNTFSIKDYTKANLLQQEIILDLRAVLNEWGKDEVGYLDAQKQLKELDICLASSMNLVMNIKGITPLEGKEVRMDLPKIREEVEAHRKYYTINAKTIESTDKIINEVVQILINAEKWNSFNLDKTDIIKYKLRIEGESAILESGEILPGKRIK